jgi:hypothetical protein
MQEVKGANVPGAKLGTPWVRMAAGSGGFRIEEEMPWIWE